MDRDLISVSQRVRWAIAQTGKTHRQLAALVGVSAPVLSQWSANDETFPNARVVNAKQFAEVTGTRLEWLLTGDGPRIDRYTVEAHPLMTEAQHMVQEAPELAETGYRLLKALAQGSGLS